MTAWEANDRIREEDYTGIILEVNTRIWWEAGSIIQQESYHGIALEAQRIIRQVAKERAAQ